MVEGSTPSPGIPNREIGGFIMIVLRNWSIGKAFVGHTIRWAGLALCDNERSKIEEIAQENGMTMQDVYNQALALGLKILCTDDSHLPIENTTTGASYQKD